MLWWPVVRWVARHVLHVTPAPYTNDAPAPPIDVVVGILCMVVLAAVFTGVWSYFDRRRGDYRGLHAWLRVYLRFSTGILLISYGLEKVLLNQFDSPPNPSVLLTPVGMLSRFGLLVVFMASSPLYQAFAGAVELVAGVLLMLRRTAPLGAFLAVAAMTNVVVLNWAYHFTVYVLSTSILAMALFLAVPELPVVTIVLVHDRAAPAPVRRPLFGDARVNQVARALGVGFLLAVFVHGFHTIVTTGVHWRDRPPLYGAWDVETVVRSPDSIPPLLTDETRWRRFTVDPTRNRTVDGFAVVLFARDTGFFAIRLDNDTQDPGAHISATAGAGIPMDLLRARHEPCRPDRG